MSIHKRRKGWTVAGIEITLLLCLQAAAPGKHIGQSDSTTGPDSPPVSEASSLTDRDLQAFLDPIFDRGMEEFHVPGAVFVLVKEGRTVLAKGYGVADLETERPILPEHTVFRLGSISKLFTATAALQLWEKGLLELDQDVNHYLQAFRLPDNYPQPLTLRHLLTHTAGLDERGIGTMARTPDEVIPLVRYLETHMPPRVMPPGETVSYSNHGMALTGYLVEVLSGVPFDRYVDENILKPLGMIHTSFALPAGLAEHLASGYQYEDGAYQKVPGFYLNVGPAGSAVGTGTDMATFMIAHLQNGQFGSARILQESTVREMQGRQFTHHPRLPGFGYAFYECFRNGVRAIMHGGSLPGYASVLLLVPSHQVGFFIAYTRLDHRLNEEIIEGFFDRYFSEGERSAAAPLSAFDSSEGLQEFAGRYRWNRYSRHTLQKLITFNTEFQVIAAKSRVILHYPPYLRHLRKATDWIQREPLSFQRADGEPGEIAFRKDEAGHITHMFLAYRDFFPIALERLAWYESSPFQIGVTACIGGVFLSPWILGMVRFFTTTARAGRNSSHLVRRRRLLVALVCGLNLLFVLGLATGLLLTSPWDLGFGVPWPYKLILSLPLLSTLFTPGLFLLTWWIWRRKEGSVPERIHLLLVSVSTTGFLALLHYWNLLGYRF